MCELILWFIIEVFVEKILGSEVWLIDGLYL